MKRWDWKRLRELYSTRLVERADVLAVEEVVVGELEDEVDEQAAPDHHVVEHRPVRRVQRDLGAIQWTFRILSANLGQVLGQLHLLYFIYSAGTQDSVQASKLQVSDDHRHNN